MSKSLRIWLIFALVLCALTTLMNALLGRYLSAAIAVGSIASLCVLLFAHRRGAFYALCAFSALSFLVGVYQGIAEGTGILLSLGASLVGSALVPLVTFLFLRRQPENLK